jgi:hypothetical protein
MGLTNRGKRKYHGILYQGETPPTNFYVALVTSAVAPTADTNTFSELTEIAAGNGYTAGGIQLARNSTDFDNLTENDSTDVSTIQIKDLVWTASGGPIPASGDGARYAVLTDDNATAGDREVWAFWDLGQDQSVADGDPLTLRDFQLQLEEPA